MKKWYFILLFSLLILSCLYSSFLLKKNNVSDLNNDQQKILIYRKWGLDTKDFSKMYDGLLNDANSTSFIIFPFKLSAFYIKRDNILRLTQAAYAIQVTKLKEEVQTRLSYLRERIKNSTTLTQNDKQIFSDSLEVIAGKSFEITNDINSLKKSYKSLEEQDALITTKIETVKKESLITELQNYKKTCEGLFIYFTDKNSISNKTLASNCINEADKLMGPRYKSNGADFIEALSRERVFTLAQQASKAKHQIEQEELYLFEVKKKQEEILTIVPPALRQEGKVIVVNLALQRLYAYDNGISIFPTAVTITTGKYGFETVTGEFAVYLKELQHKMVSPFPGIYYDDVVNYWMPFYLGYGLHDAPWRSIYGTQDYVTVGSHGCVNIPLKDTIILYNWAEVGTRVIVI